MSAGAEYLFFGVGVVDFSVGVFSPLCRAGVFWCRCGGFWCRGGGWGREAGVGSALHHSTQDE